MFSDIGKKIGPFYFTIGGIGDLLLTLHGFYQIDMPPTSLVVWANDRDIAKQILSKENFPALKYSIITDNFVGHPKASEYYNAIIGDVSFKGKFHIPDNLQYVKEWMGVKDVFSHYGIPRKKSTLRDMFLCDSLPFKDYAVIHPYSLGRDGVIKGKVIEQENLVKVLDLIRSQNISAIVCIGTREEQNAFRIFMENRQTGSRFSVEYPTTITDAMRYVANASHVYSADTWTKTMAGLCEVPTTAFTCSADMSQLFPQIGYDPSDNIFMHGWGFEVIKQFGKDQRS
jgi:hypothetical protein